MKIKSTFLKLILGFAILGILIYNIGIKSILETISRINLFYIPIILIIILITNFFGTWKIILFLKATDIKISFIRLYHLYFLSWCLSLFMPGRIGEFALIYFFKKRGASLGISSALVVMDKIIGVIVTFLIALIGIFLFFSLTQSLKIISLLVLLIGGGIFIIFSNFGRKLIKRFILRKWESKFAGFSKTLFSILKKKKIMSYNFVLSAIKWVISSFVVYTLFLALGQKVPVLMVILVTATSAIVSLIPISINGLGIRESTAVFLFTLVNVSPALSTSVFLIIIIINYIIAAIYLLLFFNQKDYKLKIRKLLNQNS